MKDTQKNPTNGRALEAPPVAVLVVAVPTVVPLVEATVGVIDSVPDVLVVVVVVAVADAVEVGAVAPSEVTVAEVGASTFGFVLVLTLTELVSLSASPHLTTVS